MIVMRTRRTLDEDVFLPLFPKKYVTRLSTPDLIHIVLIHMTELCLCCFSPVCWTTRTAAPTCSTRGSSGPVWRYERRFSHLGSSSSLQKHVLDTVWCSVPCVHSCWGTSSSGRASYPPPVWRTWLWTALWTDTSSQRCRPQIHGRTMFRSARRYETPSTSLWYVQSKLDVSSYGWGQINKDCYVRHWILWSPVL